MFCVSAFPYESLSVHNLNSSMCQRSLNEKLFSLFVVNLRRRQNAQSEWNRKLNPRKLKAIIRR